MINLMHELIDHDLGHLNIDFYRNVFQVPSLVVEKIKLDVYVSEQMQMDDKQILMDQPSLMMQQQPIDTYHIVKALDQLINVTLEQIISTFAFFRGKEKSYLQILDPNNAMVDTMN